jgi:hypothetical protein
MPSVTAIDNGLPSHTSTIGASGAQQESKGI